MKLRKICLSAALLLAFLMLSAFAGAEGYPAKIVCETEIPVTAEGSVIYVTKEDYASDADIPFTVEWYRDLPEENGELCASADMVITDDGKLYYAGSGEVPAGLMEVLKAETAAEEDAHAWSCDEVLLPAADCLTPGIALERCAECSAVRFNLVEGSHRVAIDRAVAPTDKENGLTQGSHCAVCGTVLVKQYAVPAGGNADGAAPGINPGGLTYSACTETGHDFVDGYCTRCWEPCPHADIRILITTADTHHFVCNDCGKRVVDFHAAENGFCIVCGYRVGVCEHARVRVVYTIPDSHYVECLDCGQRKLEPHTADACLCAVCGYGEGHTAVTDAAAAPTCTADGRTEGSHCSVCGTVLIAQETVPATGHTVVTDAAVPATCTTMGLTEGSHCSVCAAVLAAQKATPYDHDYSKGFCVRCSAPCPHENQQALEKRRTDHTASCLDCGMVITAAHEWRDGACKICGFTCPHEVINDGYRDSNFHGSTCAECDVLFLEAHEYAGSRSCLCTVCGYYSHNYSRTTPYGVVRYQSCTRCGTPCSHGDVLVFFAVEGRHDAVCRICGKEFSGEHSFDGCFCTVCGYAKHTAVTDAAAAPTCTKNGLTEGSHCGVCGTVLVKQESVPCLGHIPAADSAVEPTCSAPGLTDGAHCSRCGEVLIAQEEVPVIPHQFNFGACTVCGASCPHENKNAADADNFTHALYCADCGEALPPEEHSMALYRAPFLYYCPVCGHLFV